MKKKLIGIFVCMLVFTSVILPVTASSIEEQEETPNDEKELVLIYIVGLLRGYKESDEHYEFNFKIGFAFFIGVSMAQPIFGPRILFGLKLYDKDGFEGMLTQSRIIGRLIESGPE